jgi:hypothetical protein
VALVSANVKTPFVGKIVTTHVQLLNARLPPHAHLAWFGGASTVSANLQDPATGNIHLLVVNQSTNETARISGFESWNVVGWNQLTADSYTNSNRLGVAGPEPIQTQAVALPALGAALVIPPTSVNHIILSASTSTNPPVTTPPTISISSPTNHATASGLTLGTCSSALSFRIGCNAGRSQPSCLDKVSRSDS